MRTRSWAHLQRPVPDSLHGCQKGQLGAITFQAPETRGWFESGNVDGQEEAEDRDETAERAEAAEKGWTSGEVREEITSIIGLPTTCQAWCEDYP